MRVLTEAQTLHVVRVLASGTAAAEVPENFFHIRDLAEFLWYTVLGVRVHDATLISRRSRFTVVGLLSRRDS